ncbi:MarR family winged helix-turn-helix transcriptional regulator [Prolixibacter denitrificans]|uniref:MarR family transcriptional regulator n=1 Tax=Prolixibacter denitrificans TaxID=1541063 RepID=A0A2P8C7F8_9BACT|nr:MarR family transcriptional regulator [Prolixibacter denitrificans]PSK80910.1 DNA-binding MarR family transcriptional regulator [Prolixibacter denitrificans]GET22314.1 MarR family transcriptional regulator [Prolixibacter denitrificans]
MDFTPVIIKIRRIVRSINLESKKVQKEYGVSIPQLLCLEYLKEAPNYQATQRMIRDHLRLNSSTMTGIINRLEKKGYVARLPKSGDKRVTNIALTSSGERILTHTPDLMQKRLDVKLRSLSDEEINKINSALDTLIDMLEIEDIDASPVLTGGEENVRDF